MMRMIKSRIPGLEIQASVNCYIKTVEQAEYFSDCDVITTDRDINRDIGLIKEIMDATGKRIKILINEGCLNS
jgi:collagenase-like PrtC family protease